MACNCYLAECDIPACNCETGHVWKCFECQDREIETERKENEEPFPLLLSCPECRTQHIDEGEWATTKVHRTHLCKICGTTWRPSNRATVGVGKLEET